MGGGGGGGGQRKKKTVWLMRHSCRLCDFLTSWPPACVILLINHFCKVWKTPPRFKLRPWSIIYQEPLLQRVLDFRLSRGLKSEPYVLAKSGGSMDITRGDLTKTRLRLICHCKKNGFIYHVTVFLLKIYHGWHTSFVWHILSEANLAMTNFMLYIYLYFTYIYFRFWSNLFSFYLDGSGALVSIIWWGLSASILLITLHYIVLFCCQLNIENKYLLEKHKVVQKG